MKIKHQICTAIATVAPLWTGAAQAQPAQRAQFNIGNVTMEVPAPDGFCLPTKQAATVLQMHDRLDTVNATLAIFLPCAKADDPSSADFFVIKSPRATTNTPITRSQLIKTLREQSSALGDSERVLSDDADTAINENAKENVGVDPKVKTDLRVMGTDEDCVYMGGTVLVAAVEPAATSVVGVCISAIGNRMFAAYRFIPGSQMREARPLLPLARKLAMSVRLKR